MKRSLTVCLCAMATAIVVLAFPPSTSYAATFTVTRTDDPAPDGCQVSDCSLREAIIAANTTPGHNLISLPAGTYTLSRPRVGAPSVLLDAENGDLLITGSLKLQGAGKGTTFIQAGTNTSNGIDRILFVDTTATVEVTGVTLRFGRVVDESGGGVVNRGDLTLTEMAVSQNTIAGGQQTGAQGGGISNSGTLKIVNSEVTANSTWAWGGGIANSADLSIFGSLIAGNTAGQWGGGVYQASQTELLINTSTLSQNISGWDGGAIAGGGNFILRESTVSGNLARRSGGGLYGSRIMTIVNTTISGNRANVNGGGIEVTKGLYEAALVSLNSTITDNYADQDFNGSGEGGGISGDYVTIHNTILADNWESTPAFGGYAGTRGDCSGSIQSPAPSLVSAVNPLRCTIDGSVLTADPKLGPLQNNGGPTETRLPSDDSPVLNAGGPNGCRDTNGLRLAYDQRGVPRELAFCDIGAVQRNIQPNFTIALPLVQQ